MGFEPRVQKSIVKERERKRERERERESLLCTVRKWQYIRNNEQA